ncbi:hypothetical protein CBER1_02567 [Cercospora berteroae]|uniref:Glycosyltransferase family 31 protein n=1 Tax=Cercospora berteroae TaxID=357750 RepID=A0A2S6CEH9_9PEZI|nr:hypothetical protein CBER1_02567 [Cercospora berteroae]
MILLIGWTATGRRAPRLDFNAFTQVENTTDCAFLDDVREALSLPPTIQYARRVIRSRSVNNPINSQGSPIKVDTRLIPAFESVRFDHEDCHLKKSASENGGEPAMVEYNEPSFGDIDTSRLLLGASTSLHRFEKVIPQLARWLANTKASLVVNIRDHKDPAKMERVQMLAEAAGIDAVLLHEKVGSAGNGDDHAQQNFAIIKCLHRRRELHHKWFAVIDEDTFFPSLPAVLHALQPYDPSKPWYIGSMSEDWSQIAQKHGYMAYGGAGIFFSGPLLDVLHENFDACVKNGFGGDELYKFCIYSHTSPPVQLTLLSGLHQLDFHVDASGWYEAVPRPLLSLHHYNSWHLYPVEYGHLVADICGAECFLLRYRFAENVVLTNGYSVAHYPAGADHLDLARVEGTFEHDDEQFLFSLGAIRPKLSIKEKTSWRLEYAQKTPSGDVRQFYIRRKGHNMTDHDRLKTDVESVLELEWKR